MLTKQINDAQQSAKQANEATEKLALKIQEKEKLKKQLELESSLSEEQISTLNEEIDNLKSSQVSLKSECISYQEEIDRVEADCANVEAKLKDLQTHYNTFVESNAKSREELLNSYNQKVNKLSCNMLFIALKGMVEKRSNSVLLSLRVKRQEAIGKQIGGKTICSIASSYRTNVLRLAFRKYVGNTLQWGKEREVKENAIDAIDSLKTKQSVFSKWRNVFLKNADKMDKAQEGAKIIIRILNTTDRRRSRIVLIQWLESATVKQKQIIILKHLLLKKIERNESAAFSVLLAHSKKTNVEIQYNNLASEIAQIKYQMKVYDCIYSNAQIEKNIKVEEHLNKLWDKIKSKCKTRFLKSSAIALARIAKINHNKLITQAWSMLKCNRLSCNINKLTDQLNTETNALKEAQFSTASTQQQIIEEKKASSIRRIIIHFHKRLASYFDKWLRFRIATNTNIKAIQKIYIRNAQVAKKSLLQKWHHSAQHDTLVKMGNAQKKAEQVADDLQGHLNATKEALNKLNDRLLKRRSNKLRRVVKQKSWNYERRAIRVWSYINKWLNMITAGHNKLEKLCNRKKEKNGLMKYRSIVQAIKKTECLEYKFNNEVKNLNFWLMIRAMKDLKKGVHYQHREKHFLITFAQRKRMKLKAKAIQIWAGKYYKTKIIESQQFSETAEIQTVQKEESIGQLNKEIIVLKEELSKCLQKQNQQSVLVLTTTNARKWNFILRKSFNKWRTFNKNTNKKESFISLFTSVRKRNLKHQALAKWQVFKHRTKIEQIKVATNEKQKKIEAISKLMENNSTETNKKLDEINSQITQLNQQQEFHENRIEAFSQFLSNKINNYTHQRITRRVLQGWKKVVKIEKDLLAKVIDASAKYTNEDIFMKIKQKDTDVYSMQHTAAILSKMLNKSCRVMYRKAIRKWQEFSKNKGVVALEMEKQEVETKLHEVEAADMKQDEAFRENAERMLVAKKKREMFTALAQQTKKQKTLNTEVEHFKKTRNDQIKENVMELMKNRNDQQRKYAWAVNTLETKAKNNMIKGVFKYWRRHTEKTKALPTVVARILSRHNADKKAICFHVLSAHSTYEEATKKLLRQNSIAKALKIILLCEKRIIMDGFTKFRYNTMKKAYFLSLIKRITQRVFNHKLRNSLNMWRNKNAQVVTIEKVNTVGKKAQEVHQMEMKMASIQKVLEGEGYRKEAVNEIVKEAYNKENASIKEAITRWIHYNTDPEIILEAMRKWRDKVAKIKLLRKKCAYIFRQLSKGDSGNMQRAFRKWKFEIIKIKNTVVNLPKKEIVKKVIEGMKNIESLKYNKEQTTKRVESLQEEVQQLGEKCSIGKQVTIANIKRMMNTRLSRGIIANQHSYFGEAIIIKLKRQH